MTKISYSRHGDYYLPDLTLPDQENCFIGKYGLLRKKYLITHRRILYINLLTSGRLNEHLTEIEKQATERLDLLINQMAISQGITESLKASDQMAWVWAMNNIKACAEEIILKEIVYI